MNRTTLEFELAGGRDVAIQVFLDGRILDLKIPRKASLEVLPGTHVVQVFAVGSPEARFRLSIRTAKEGPQLWSRDFTLPADGMMAISKKIVVPKEPGGTTRWPGPHRTEE